MQITISLINVNLYISIMQHTFKSRIDRLDRLRLNYLTVSEEILEKFWRPEDTGSVYNQRFIIVVNDQVRWQGGTVVLGGGNAYITFSKARMKEIGVDLGDTVDVTLERDFSKYGFDLPEEFEEVLRQDDEARRRFESLTMGTKRAIIYIVVQLKSSEKRLEKTLFLLENLKRAPAGEETMRHVLGKDLP